MWNTSNSLSNNKILDGPKLKASSGNKSDVSQKTKRSLTLYSIDTHFDASATVFENIVGKGEIAANKQFLLFPQCFLPNQIIVSPFVHIFDIISLFAAELEEPKTVISGKGLTHSLIQHFETVPNSTMLQTTTAMWLFKDF